MSDTSSAYPSISAWDSATTVPRSGGRRPPRWLPNGGIVVPQASSILGNGHQGWTQIAPQRPGRHDIVIVNLTSNIVFLSSVQAATNPITLGANASWSIDTEGEVWAWSLNGSSVDVVETVYPLTTGAFAPGGPIPSIEPLVNW